MNHPANSGGLQQLKLKYNFSYFLFRFWGYRCKDIQQIQKDIPRQKVFGSSEFCSSRQNHSRPNSLENCGFGGKNKTQSFQKLFVRGYLFVFVEYLCNRSPKIETKNIKNYSSILAVVNHRNWLDDSPPLNGYVSIRLKCSKLVPKFRLEKYFIG